MTAAPRTGRPEQAHSPLTTTSLFSGIGGIERGLCQSGAASLTSLCERWDPARSVLQAHYPGIAVADDVTALTGLGAVDLATAGFPCTDLSQAGLTRGLDGLQSGLVLRVLQMLETSRPRWVLLENVPNMLHLGSGHAMTRIVSDLERAGYRWAYRVVDSRFTGLAQRRRRVLLLASQSGAADPAPLLLGEDAGPLPDPPDATAFGFSWTEGNRGLGWAVGAVPTLRGGTTVRVPSPPAVWLPGAEPGHRIVRPSIESAEVLQGFPAGWTAVAPDRDRWKLVGNAVSPPVARWLGERLLARGSVDDLATDSVLLDAGARWPRAAHGERGKRWHVDVSEFPRHPSPQDRQDLAEVLRSQGSAPLSHRATRGFRDRLRASSLTYRDDFMADLDAHGALTAAGGPSATP